MTRQRSDKRQPAAVERPEPLGRPTALQTHGEALRRLSALVDFPLKPAFYADAYPQVNGAHDAAIIRREEARRHEHWNDDEL